MINNDLDNLLAIMRRQYISKYEIIGSVLCEKCIHCGNHLSQHTWYSYCCPNNMDFSFKPEKR